MADRLAPFGSVTLGCEAAKQIFCADASCENTLQALWVLTRVAADAAVAIKNAMHPAPRKMLFIARIMGEYIRLFTVRSFVGSSSSGAHAWSWDRDDQVDFHSDYIFWRVFGRPLGFLSRAPNPLTYVVIQHISVIFRPVSPFDDIPSSLLHCCNGLG